MSAHPPTAAGAERSLAQELDIRAHAAVAQACASLSPFSTQLAVLDWGAHLAISPGKRMELCQLALQQAEQITRFATQAFLTAGKNDIPAPQPPTQDRRFAAPAWQQWPFNVWQQSFVLGQQWWQQATSGVMGAEPRHQNLVAFGACQWLETMAPDNQPATNPHVLQQTLDEQGANLVRGAQHWVEDFQRMAQGESPAGATAHQVGQGVAITAGQVVLHNRVMELIQYTPTTAKVHPEPVLIVPAWIMKYYVLDLSPHNSLIKYLVDQGHTVFCISWKNPGKDERDLGMDEYLQEGFHAALDAVQAIVPRRKVHGVGYCLGGTLLSIAAAAMARDGDERLASLTLLAAQTDFSEPGELSLFIDASQVSLLEAQMAEAGYLTGDQMAGAFKMLRSHDLMWTQLMDEYLLGERAPTNDLMAWNADTTRMPAKMHSQYLRRLFLNNDLSADRYPVDGRPVSLADIHQPIFMVGTSTDHVAPWRSVYKLHHHTAAEITFALTSGGHNAGVVNPPGNPRRHYQILTRSAGGAHVSADEWQALAPQHQDSWWPAWQQWLAAHSEAPIKPPRMGAANYRPVCDAPGTYVMER